MVTSVMVTAVAAACSCLQLPAAACCCLQLPAAACCCLLLPAAACCCLLLPAGRPAGKRCRRYPKGLVQLSEPKVTRSYHRNPLPMANNAEERCQSFTGKIQFVVVNYRPEYFFRRTFLKISGTMASRYRYGCLSLLHQ